MKRIELIKIDSFQATVADYQEIFQNKIEPSKYTEMFMGDKVLMHSHLTYEVENIPIQSVVEQGAAVLPGVRQSHAGNLPVELTVRAQVWAQIQRPAPCL